MMTIDNNKSKRNVTMKIGKQKSTETTKTNIDWE